MEVIISRLGRLASYTICEMFTSIRQTSAVGISIYITVAIGGSNMSSSNLNYRMRMAFFAALLSGHCIFAQSFKNVLSRCVVDRPTNVAAYVTGFAIVTNVGVPGRHAST